MIIHHVTKARISVADPNIIGFNMQMTVAELMSVAQIDRLQETEGGVQRKQNARHVEGITRNLVDPDSGSTVSQNMICEIVGPYEYDEDALTLTIPDGTRLSLLDGGSRFESFRRMPPAKQRQIDVPLMVRADLTFSARLGAFQQQTQHRRVDPRHMLALTHAAGSWKNDLDQEIYELLLMMNGDPNSPLHGRISFQEEERNYSARHKPDGVNVVGLLPAFRKIFGSKSPLGRMDREQHAQYAKNLFNAARRTWPKVWTSDDHVVTSARGLKALIFLVTDSPAFVGVLGGDFSAEKIQSALDMASTYKWDTYHNKGKTVDQMISGINQSIARKANAV